MSTRNLKANHSKLNLEHLEARQVLTAFTPVPLVDINQTADVAWKTDFVEFQDKVVFASGDETTGIELWQTDGTAAGTKVLHDVAPGPASGMSFGSEDVFGSRIHDYRVTQNRQSLFFNGNDGERDFLWMSDGENARPIYPGSVSLLSTNETGAFFAVTQDDRHLVDGSEDEFINSFKHDVYFVAGESGAVSYLTTINNNDDDGHMSSLGGTADYEVLRFCPDDGPCSIYTSDGTLQGTRKIDDIDGHQLLNWQGQDYLIRPNVGLYQLSSDGLSVDFISSQDIGWNAAALEDLPLVYSSGQRLFARASIDAAPVALGVDGSGQILPGDTVYFANEHFRRTARVWSTDGTREGSQLVAEFEPGSTVHLASTFGDVAIAVVANTEHQYEIWRIDPSAEATTTLLASLSDFDSATGARFQFGETVVDESGRSFFAMPSTSGKQIWTIDTPAAPSTATNIIATLNPGTKSIQMRDIKTLDDGTAIFVANSTDFSNFFPRRSSLWQTDGTQDGTVELTPGPDWVRHVVAAGDRVLYATTADFSFVNSPPESLWVYDADTKDTLPFAAAVNLPGELEIGRSYVLGSRLAFRATNGGATQIWTSDGTAEGTILLLDLGQDPDFQLRIVDDTLTIRGTTTYVSDGTIAGTRQIADGEELPVRESIEIPIGDGILKPIDATQGFGLTWQWTNANGHVQIANGGDFRVAQPDNVVVIQDSVYYIAQSMQDYEYRLLRLSVAGGEPTITAVMEAPVSFSFGRAGNNLIVARNNGISGFEPTAIPLIDGDANLDGTVDFADVDEVCAAIHQNEYLPQTGRYELDMNNDYRLDRRDLDLLLSLGLNSRPGDVTGDGRFDSADLVQIFQQGGYDDGIQDNSLWSTGDWNCDADFDSADIVFALTRGYDG